MDGPWTSCSENVARIKNQTTFNGKIKTIFEVEKCLIQKMKIQITSDDRIYFESKFSF